MFAFDFQILVCISNVIFHALVALENLITKWTFCRSFILNVSVFRPPVFEPKDHYVTNSISLDITFVLLLESS